MNRKSLKWHLVEVLVTYDFPLHLGGGGHVTTVHDFGSVLGWPLNTSFGLSYFMVMALGSCVKQF